MTIIERFSLLRQYPIDAIPSDIQALLKQSFPMKVHSQKQRAVLEFECFLQITNQSLQGVEVGSDEFNRLVTEFIGALSSESFMRCTNTTRASKIVSWQNMLKHLTISYPSVAIIYPSVAVIDLITSGISNEFRSTVRAAFENIKLNQKAVRYWTGWKVRNISGKESTLELASISRRFGEKFANCIAESLSKFSSQSKSQIVHSLVVFFHFVASYDGVVDDFKSPSACRKLLRDFIIFFTTNSKLKGIHPATAKLQWNAFVRIFLSYFIPDGIFAMPAGGMPKLIVPVKPGTYTNVKKTAQGILVKTKLLSDVPLEMSDEAAMTQLFSALESDLNIVTAWAKHESNSLWERYQLATDLGKFGIPVPINDVIGVNNGHRWLISRDNPNYLANAAATLSTYGFRTGNDVSLPITFPSNAQLLAQELGLPTTYSLLPFCTLLVAEHPQLTPSALQSLCLFDKNGKNVGFRSTDSGYVLVVYKQRKGAGLAEQVIHLTESSAEIVKKIVILTEPLRKYLKAKGDDNWRRLLLTCGQAFGYPLSAEINKIFSADFRQSVATKINELFGISPEKCAALAKRFTLISVRATAGVMVYVKTGSVEKMAEALGHTAYCPKLLDRYLPRPIWDFILTRWIRSFQNSIIFHSMRDSKNLLAASDFNNVEALNEFISNHALNIPETFEGESRGRDSTENNVLIGVNEDILTSLLAIKSRAPHSSKKAEFNWARIAELIESSILRNAAMRPDLASFLERAKRNLELA